MDGKVGDNDYYALLGIEKNASVEEIRKAYHKKALKLHPDRAGGNEKLFREVTEAYEVLVDAEKRDAYDRGAPEPTRSKNFNIFRKFFQEMEQQEQEQEEQANRKETHHIQRPQDIHFNLEISSKELYYGCKKKLGVRRKRKCPLCFSQTAETCHKCKGRGFERRLERKPLMGDVMIRDDCVECLGSGLIFSSSFSSCDRCGGSRLVQDKAVITLDVDAGCPENYAIIRETEGNDLTLPGQPTGDLVVKVTSLLPAGWSRNEQDMIYETKKTIMECICENNFIEINHLDGDKYVVSIPFVVKPTFKDNAGQDWAFVYVENGGLPFFRELKKYGRLIVAINITYPEKLLNTPFIPSEKRDDEKKDDVVQKQWTAQELPFEEQTKFWQIIYNQETKDDKKSKFTELPQNVGCTHQ